MKKTNKTLFYIGLAILIVGIACLITSIILDRVGQSDIGEIFGIISAIAGPVSLLILIFYLMFFGLKEPQRGHNTVRHSQQKVIKEVDVKPIKKTRQEELYEQYEDLYKKNLISKEDLDKKRVELLGK